MRKIFRLKTRGPLFDTMRKSHLLDLGYIYALALKENRIYIGETADLKRRLREHVTGLYYDTKKRRWIPGGAVITRNFKPVRLVGLYRPNLDYSQFQHLVETSKNLQELEASLRKKREDTEADITLQYMKLHGRNQVWGANWCCLKKTPAPETVEKFHSRRLLCKCAIPAEKIITFMGKEKWVCGSHLIHDLFGNKLVPTSRGLLFQLGSDLEIPVALECVCDKAAETAKRFLPGNKEDSS